ncbi:response regulator [Streptacidiphilus jiangxiensis]|uniref:Two-component system, NarL family, nitrate/nitrite response regulator NarL n=1 Tax=Streptacidiphilus jiangxiensis TaxID=235985 RepID=A0A1H7HHL8_STRJI|nr:response regulator transcription factor [Streptacidiphilus jiangxiensis]SEK48952.1 two-component system, NarL family, nitrate/nitrite response regulator NarL [Streptacidiphilus jiangxiensis]
MGRTVLENAKISVVVADDHPLYREGVRRALVQSGRIDVVAEAENGREALAAIRQHRPEVALVDYQMPGLDGIAVVHAVVRDELPTRVLLLTAFEESALVFKAVQEGAAGYLLKDSSRDEIVGAVAQAANGSTVLPAGLATGLAAEIRLRHESDQPVLSERERQVLELFAAGKSVPDAAAELFLSPSTVKSHVQHLYAKLGVSDRAAAVAEALRRGLLE